MIVSLPRGTAISMVMISTTLSLNNNNNNKMRVFFDNMDNE